MATQTDQCLLLALSVLEKVCQNYYIFEESKNSSLWTNALNDCIALAKKVARRVDTARSLGQTDWGRFMDVICTESKVPEMLPDTVFVLNASLRLETVLSSISNTEEFYQCLRALTQLAENIENNHRTGMHLGDKLWKELRSVVRKNDSALQTLDSISPSERDPAIQRYKERLLTMPLEEKRKLYACKSDFKTLSDIQSWEDSAPKLLDTSMEDEDPLYPVHAGMNQRISLFEGDITTLEIDAIVNSVNSTLPVGEGVAGSIHRAAGPTLAYEWRDLNGIEVGKAKMTGGYLLPAQYIIHTAGPIGKDADELKSCYKQCLKLLIENRLRTIAFPCISTGLRGYPNQQAAVVALKTVREFLEFEENLGKVDRIIFCVYLPADASIYKDYLPVYFPV